MLWSRDHTQPRTDKYGTMLQCTGIEQKVWKQDTPGYLHTGSFTFQLPVTHQQSIKVCYTMYSKMWSQISFFDTGLTTVSDYKCVGSSLDVNTMCFYIVAYSGSYLI